MSQNLGAVPIQDNEYQIINILLQWREHLRYMDNNTLALKLVIFMIIMLFIMRLLYICLYVLFPHGSVRKRAKVKKKD